MNKIVPKNVTLIPDTATKVFTGKIFDVYQWQQEMFDGSSATFEMLKRPDTVIVIGIVNDRIIVIDDEQPHLGKRAGFPGGRVDPTDSSVELAARREVIEETGYHFKNYKLIDVQKPVHKMEWFIYTFLSWDVAKIVEPTPDAGEKIKVNFKTFQEVQAMIRQQAGYIGEAGHIFDEQKNIDGLMAIPEYKGQEVNR